MANEKEVPVFRITSPAGAGDEGWVVATEWFGAERVVFGPASVFACTRWVAAQERSSR